MQCNTNRSMKFFTCVHCATSRVYSKTYESCAFDIKKWTDIEDFNRKSQKVKKKPMSACHVNLTTMLTILGKRTLWSHYCKQIAAKVRQE